MIYHDDAIQFTGNFDAIEEFVGGDAEYRAGQLVVATLHGALFANRADWIVRDAHGRFSVVPDAVMRGPRPLHA